LFTTLFALFIFEEAPPIIFGLFLFELALIMAYCAFMLRLDSLTTGKADYTKFAIYATFIGKSCFGGNSAGFPIGQKMT
jgi:hypothetical protein